MMLTPIAPVAPSKPIPCTAAGYIALQRARAQVHAPAGPVDEATFRRLASAYPLAVLRHASTRWSPARGRTLQAVLDQIVANLANPHVNHGDDYAIALGHLQATYLRGV